MKEADTLQSLQSRVSSHIEALESATTENCVFSICQSFCQLFEADYFTYGVILSSSFNHPKHKIINNYPIARKKQYDRNAYLLIDPIITHCTHGTHGTGPVFWPINEQKINLLNPNVQKMMSSAKAHGLATSITIPIHDHRGCTGFFGLCSKQDTPSIRVHMKSIAPYISYFTSFIHEKMIELEGISNSRRETSLTEREKECLSWGADGKTAWEIASILSISERTVNFHLQNTMLKLKTVSKPHSIAKAIAQGYIRPELSNNHPKNSDPTKPLKPS